MFNDKDLTELVRENQRLSSLVGLAGLLADPALGLDEKLERCLKELAWLAGAESASLMLVEGGSLVVRAASNPRLLGLATDPALDLQECLRRARLEQPRADLALLGMGEDGHTASLFPGAAGIESALDPDGPERYVGVIPPAAPHPRISMSLAALLQCPELLLAISGPAKRRVFDTACADPRSSLPVARLLHQDRVTVRTFWAA